MINNFVEFYSGYVKITGHRWSEENNWNNVKLFINLTTCEETSNQTFTEINSV